MYGEPIYLDDELSHRYPRFYKCGNCGEEIENNKKKEKKFCPRCETVSGREALLKLNDEIKKENLAKGFSYEIYAEIF